jgi:hypothetical protein
VATTANSLSRINDTCQSLSKVGLIPQAYGTELEVRLGIQLSHETYLVSMLHPAILQN